MVCVGVSDCTCAQEKLRSVEKRLDMMAVAPNNKEISQQDEKRSFNVVPCRRKYPLQHDTDSESTDEPDEDPHVGTDFGKYKNTSVLDHQLTKAEELQNK